MPVHFESIIGMFVSIEEMINLGHTLGFDLSKASPTVKHFVCSLND